MSRSHNKKRNVGIIYEQIISFICQKLIENNKKEAEKATNIITNHFKKGTQLYKEYKLFKALVSTNNISDQLASNIIIEAKKACNNLFDSKVLEYEKSHLIKELNYNFGKGVIFNQKIEDYRIYATIQTLLNEWRNSDNNFVTSTEYEIKLHNFLTEKRDHNSSVMPKKVTPLIRSLMNKKFEEKYSSFLNQVQKKLIENFIQDDEDVMHKSYKDLKRNCLNDLNNYIVKCENKILINKSQKIINNIQQLDESDTTKENLQKFLIIAKLKEELLGE